MRDNSERESPELTRAARATLDWSFKGMKTLILENKLLRVAVLLDKGSDIFQLVYKPLDIDLIWHSPNGYRNPEGYVQDSVNPADIFHDYYGGGWNDVFPNYGNPSENRGARFSGHGESALLPWACVRHDVDGGAHADLSVECVRYPLRAEKTISLDPTKALLTISEDIINLSGQQIEISWAQHIAYGEPFVDEGMAIEIPARRARTHYFEVPYTRLARGKDFSWPRAPARNGEAMVDVSRIPPRGEPVQEDFPITDLEAQKYTLYNPKLDLGVEVAWSKEALPYLWYWLSWEVPDYPFFGRARVLALEPTTSSTGNGLLSDIKNGTAKVLEPSSKLHAEITMSVFSSRDKPRNKG